MIQTPAGTRASFHIFLTCDSGLDVVINVKWFSTFSENFLDKVDVDKLVKDNNLGALGSGWRLMTDQEITEYVIDMDGIRPRQDD